jgi:hypothetical protein
MIAAVTPPSRAADLVRRTASEAPLVAEALALDAPGQHGDDRPLVDWAFDFVRDCLDLRHISPSQKTLTARIITERLVPLVGTAPLRDITPELERGVASILADEVEERPEYAVRVWHELLRWSRLHARLRRAR